MNINKEQPHDKVLYEELIGRISELTKKVNETSNKTNTSTKKKIPFNGIEVPFNYLPAVLEPLEKKLITENAEQNKSIERGQTLTDEIKKEQETLIPFLDNENFTEKNSQYVLPNNLVSENKNYLIVLFLVIFIFSSGLLYNIFRFNKTINYVIISLLGLSTLIMILLSLYTTIGFSKSFITEQFYYIILTVTTFVVILCSDWKRLKEFQNILLLINFVISCVIFFIEQKNPFLMVVGILNLTMIILLLPYWVINNQFSLIQKIQDCKTEVIRKPKNNDTILLLKNFANLIHLILTFVSIFFVFFILYRLQLN